ncbi:hypothetical protein HCN44_007049 [Aphidius gifuensis]|uniref:Uncharacterized protein n=2 Tax=Aphidius gifuensis TaxID=684658 RepID=A0A835CU19_APHGI|nr:hypothetical protein HCN44_007049 [Aphidius gifuensis]
MVKLEIHQPYSLAPSSSHSDETVAISRLPLIIAESKQKLETRPKEMQNNPDRIEALSVAAEYMQNDCAIKKEPKFENDPDEKIKSSRVPLTHAERQRKYRAKQKEKHKLQINSDGMVALTPAAEYMRKYRAKKKEQRLLNNPDGKLALSFVPMTNAERQQKYRAKLKQKNEFENNSNGMEGSSPAAEYMRNYRAEKKKQQIQNNPQEILKSTRVPLTHAERQRKYRAKQKEKHKLQINSDGREVLSSAAEYMRKYRAKKKEQKLQNNRDKKLDLPS